MFHPSREAGWVFLQRGGEAHEGTAAARDRPQAFQPRHGPGADSGLGSELFPGQAALMA